MVDFYDREKDFEKTEDEPRPIPQGQLQAFAQGEQEAPLEPYFPSSDEAIELNGAAHEAYGNQYQGLRAPNELESAINRAQQHYYYGPEEDDNQRLATAAAKMAYGIGMNQPFVDGNKRTAFWLTRHFLNENGLGHILPSDADDEEFADHLIGHGTGSHSEQDTIDLFLNRLKAGQQRQSNILDPIHDDLDPRVWDDAASPEPKLKYEHREFIYEKIIGELERHGYDGMEKWLSLVFTGSLTTYQYSDESDVDISLFVDTVNFPEWSRAEMIGVMVGNCDGTKLPGTPFPLQCFVVPPNITRDDLYQPGMRSGYELATDKWIVPPDKSRVHDVEHEMNEAYTVALENADKMDRLLRYEPDKAVQFWHQIHKRRQRDMRKGLGDYAPSNITYKMLANRNLFPAISDVSGEYIAKVADYRVRHRAPGEEDTPFHEIETVMPDFYAHPEYYSGYGDPYESEAINKLQDARERPDAPVTIYRAGPTDQINPGDWVTTTRGYALDHAKHPTDSSQDMPVWRQQVPASALWNDGGSIHEFGYGGPALKGVKID